MVYSRNMPRYRYSKLVLELADTPKYPSIELWLHKELDTLGVDSIVYGRYIISLFDKETIASPTPESRIFPRHFFPKTSISEGANSVVYSELDNKTIASLCIGNVPCDKHLNRILDELCVRLDEKNNAAKQMVTKPVQSQDPEIYHCAFPSLVPSVCSTIPQPGPSGITSKTKVKTAKPRIAKTSKHMRPTYRAAIPRQESHQGAGKNGKSKLAKRAIKDDKNTFPVGFVDKASTDVLLYSNFIASKNNLNSKFSSPTAEALVAVTSPSGEPPFIRRCKLRVEYKAGVKNMIAIDSEGRIIPDKKAKLVVRKTGQRRKDEMEDLLPNGLLEDIEIDAPVGSSDWLEHVKSANFTRNRSKNISALWPQQPGEGWINSVNSFYHNENYPDLLEKITSRGDLNYDYTDEGGILEVFAEPINGSGLPEGANMGFDTPLPVGESLPEEDEDDEEGDEEAVVVNNISVHECINARFLNTISPVSSNMSFESIDYMSVNLEASCVSETAAVPEIVYYDPDVAESNYSTCYRNDQFQYTDADVVPEVREAVNVVVAVDHNEPICQHIPVDFDVKFNKMCFFDKFKLCRVINCRFSHDIKKITCSFWMQNKCFKYDKCPYLHGFYNKNEGNKRPKKSTKNIKVFKMESDDFPSL